VCLTHYPKKQWGPIEAMYHYSAHVQQEFVLRQEDGTGIGLTVFGTLSKDDN